MYLLFDSARSRIKHFQYALSLYDEYFVQKDFQKNFLNLIDTLIKTDRSHKVSKNVFFIAVGKSAGVARLAVSMFISVGLRVQFIHPTEAFHGDFGIVNKKDTVVFISNSGNSEELLQLMPGLKERHVKIYALTSNPNSPLALKSNFVLQLPCVEEKCPLEQSPITSALTTLALCQLLVAATVEKRNFSLEDYAKNHPGGSIGKRIFLKVNNVMSAGKKLPVIPPNKKFQKLVSFFTNFGKACLLVVDHQKNLIGLIAEKDLRKAMEKFGPDVFQKTAKDIMNSNPITIKSDTLAIDAFKLMTLKKPYLNVLPVVTETGKAIGLIQIQDILALGFSVIPSESAESNANLFLNK